MTTADSGDPTYQARLAAEGKKRGDHLAIEAARRTNAWLDHPSICAHYFARGLIDGPSWY